MASTINSDNGVSSGSAGLKYSADNTGILALQTNGNTAVTIDSSLNVGIGTTSPSSPGGNINLVTSGSGLTIVKSQTNSTTTGAARYDLATGTPNSYSIIGLIDNTGSPYLQLTSGSGVLNHYYDGPNHIWRNTSSVERMRIDSSGYITNAVNGNGNGRVQAYQYYRLNADLVGANVNTAQNIFGVGVTLVGSTVYEFESVVVLSKSAGTTTHSFSMGFGGTATINNASYTQLLWYSTTGFTGGMTQQAQFIQTTASTITVSSISSSTYYMVMTLKGTVSINAGGTFIPQYTLSAAPGGAYSTIAGSYVKIAAIGVSGSNNSIGSWA